MAGAVGFSDGGVFYDNADNSVNCPAKQSIKYDDTDPTCSATYSNTGWSKSGPNASITCSDKGGSKMKTCAGSSGSKSSKSGIKSSTTYYAIDNADNKATSNSCHINIEHRYKKRTCPTSAHTKCVFDGYTSWSYTGSRSVGTGCSFKVKESELSKTVCEGSGMMVTHKFYSRSKKYKKDVTCSCTNWSGWSVASSCSAKKNQVECYDEYKKG